MLLPMGLIQHNYGFVKASAPTSNPFQVLLTDQRANRLFRVNLVNLTNNQPPATELVGVVNPWRDNIKADMTGPNPRGVVQGRYFDHADIPGAGLKSKVWVACKGGNAVSMGRQSAIYSHNFDNGLSVNRIITNQPPGSSDPEYPELPMAFGARGVCIDPHHDSHDEIWVTCFGEQSRLTPETTGNGRQILRIQDLSPLGGPLTIETIDLNDNPNLKEGPFGITCDYRGYKYVACGESARIFRIRPIPMGLIDENFDPIDRTFPWPIQLPPNRGPLGVSIDGDGNLWVQYKNGRVTTRIDINRLEQMPMANDAITDFRLTGAGKPENLGDFTGYWTATGLYPCDTSSGEGVSNIQKVEDGVNLFANTDQPFIEIEALPEDVFDIEQVDPDPPSNQIPFPPLPQEQPEISADNCLAILNT